MSQRRDFEETKEMAKLAKIINRILTNPGRRRHSNGQIKISQFDMASKFLGKQDIGMMTIYQASVKVDKLLTSAMKSNNVSYKFYRGYFTFTPIALPPPKERGPNLCDIVTVKWRSYVTETGDILTVLDSGKIIG